MGRRKKKKGRIGRRRVGKEGCDEPKEKERDYYTGREVRNEWIEVRYSRIGVGEGVVVIFELFFCSKLAVSKSLSSQLHLPF